MKVSLVAVIFAGFASIAIGAGGCSSSSSGGSSGSSSGGGGTSNIFCVSMQAGSMTCNGYSNAPASGTSTFSSQCTAMNGSVATSCPTADQVGCCTVGSSNAVVTCYYCGAVSDYQSSCEGADKGTWTSGAGGAPACGLTVYDSGTEQ